MLKEFFVFVIFAFVSSDLVEFYPKVASTPFEILEINNNYYLVTREGEIFKAGVNEVFQNIDSFKKVTPGDEPFWSNKFCYNEKSKNFLSLHHDYSRYDGWHVHTATLDEPIRFKHSIQSCPRHIPPRFDCGSEIVVSSCERYNGNSTYYNLTIGFGSVNGDIDWTLIKDPSVPKKTSLTNYFVVGDLLFIEILEISQNVRKLYYTKPQKSNNNPLWIEVPGQENLIEKGDHLVSLHLVNDNYFAYSGNSTHVSLRLVAKDLKSFKTIFGTKIQRKLAYSNEFIDPKYDSTSKKYFIPYANVIYSVFVDQNGQPVVKEEFSRSSPKSDTARGLVVSKGGSKAIFFTEYAIYSSSESNRLAVNNSVTSEIHNVFRVGNQFMFVVGPRSYSFQNNKNYLTTSSDLVNFTPLSGDQYTIPFCDYHQEIQYSEFLKLYITHSNRCEVSQMGTDIFVSKDGKRWYPIGFNKKDPSFVEYSISQVTLQEKGIFVVIRYIQHHREYPTEYNVYYSSDLKNFQLVEINGGKLAGGQLFRVHHVPKSTTGKDLSIVLGGSQGLRISSDPSLKNWNEVSIGCPIGASGQTSATTNSIFTIFRYSIIDFCIAYTNRTTYLNSWTSARVLSTKNLGIPYDTTSFQSIVVQDKVYLLVSTSDILRPVHKPKYFCSAPIYNLVSGWKCEKVKQSLIQKFIYDEKTQSIIFYGGNEGLGQLATFTINQ